MKVLGVYDKGELDRITYKGRTITEIMEDFWKLFPDSYRENYDKNIKTLELWKIDEHYEGCLGEYSDVHNLIMYTKILAIIHELMHMSARNPNNFNNAFIKNRVEALFESALIEGCTEYLSTLALHEKATNYYFEVFCASMLSNIEGFFEPYFISSYDKFIGLFPNKRDIVSLMYSLQYYADNYCFIDDYKGKAKDMFITRLRNSICDVINGLISIELSFEKGYKSNLKYGDKFMSLIRDEDLSSDLREIWKNYLGYADNQVSKRILRR